MTKKSHIILLTEDEITMYKMTKKKNPTFPQLPKFFRNQEHKTKKYIDNLGLQESVLRGFHKRVNNWIRVNKFDVTSIEGE